MFRIASSVTLLLAACAMPMQVRSDDAATLRPPSAFANIADSKERSAALFAEAARVIQSPRCINCHPVTRLPSQGDDLHDHVPYMHGGPGDHGVAGLPCATCHGEANVATLGDGIASVPGAPHWGLAPQSMAWRGFTIAEICEQLKDPSRNGGRALADIHRHVLTDPLVGWGWDPGAGRTPAPGTQARFGELVAAWIETGASCPESHTAASPGVSEAATGAGVKVGMP